LKVVGKLKYIILAKAVVTPAAPELGEPRGKNKS